MQIRKLFKAETAHQVPGAYTTRCHHLHGHSYKFELFLKSNRPNDAQMVADFKGVKDTGIADFFDSFDHAVVLWNEDPISKLAPQINPARHVIVPFIPTAEMLAKAFFVVCQAILDTNSLTLGEEDVFIEKVIVHETETGYASFESTDLIDDKFPDIQFDKWVFSAGIQKDWETNTWFPAVQARLKNLNKIH